MRKPLPLDTLRQLASQVGLVVVAVTTTEALELDKQRLSGWQEAGYAGDLSYMKREPELLASPLRIVPEARSVVVVGVAYDATPARPLGPDEGRIARYAWGRDYHKVLRKRLDALVALVSGHVGYPIRHRLFSDSVPLLERAMAARSGLGFIGKNTMLIVPKLGSFLFLGEVLWEQEVDVENFESPPSSASCGSCTSCLTRCPTGAFVSDRMLDARRCISYLTIEKRGALTVEERRWLGEWLFGCDVCQEVCPHNFVSLKTRRRAGLPELSAAAGVGEALSLTEVLAIRTDEKFRELFAGTALMRTKREGLLRNAAIVAANKHAAHLLPLLREVVRSEGLAVVRRHALWAVGDISSREGGATVMRSAVSLAGEALLDPDLGVREEAQSVLSLLPNHQ